MGSLDWFKHAALSESPAVQQQHRLSTYTSAFEGCGVIHSGFGLFVVCVVVTMPAVIAEPARKGHGRGSLGAAYVRCPICRQRGCVQEACAVAATLHTTFFVIHLGLCPTLQHAAWLQPGSKGRHCDTSNSFGCILCPMSKQEDCLSLPAALAEPAK
jgi:hypothetical protein